MTRLDALNEILTNAGLYPVDTIDETDPNQKIALQKLDNVSREVQSQGLNCNTDDKWPLMPDHNKYIPLPPNVISVDAYDSSKNYVMRDYKLFDKDNFTFKFDTPVEVTVVWELPFDDLPDYVANYVTIRAARKYANSTITNDSIDTLTRMDEQEAKVVMVQMDSANADYSIFDSYSVSKVLRRV